MIEKTELAHIIILEEQNADVKGKTESNVCSYENIRIGNLSASKEEIVRAAKLVRVHDFIRSLPQGYDTQVGENGLRLSSGEKQKIALTKAVLKNSSIVLLDEVSKSIDDDSRRSINEVINSLKDKKTIIIITHNINEKSKAAI